MANLASLISRGTTGTLLFVAALVLLFEEWLWDRSTALAVRLARLPLISDFEDWIRCRPPWQALALFVLPVAVIFPMKALALFALAHGSVLLGVTAFVMAKLLATGLFARLYQLTEPAITEFRWVRRGRDAFLRGRAFVHAWLEAQPAYLRARKLMQDKSKRMRFRYRAAYRLQRRRWRAG